MSEQSAEGAPQFDLADRMRKSLRHARVGVGEMAAYLGVSQASVSNWINGHNRPSRPTQRLWALRCGVPLDWLTGDAREGVQSGRIVRKSAFPAAVGLAAAA